MVRTPDHPTRPHKPHFLNDLKTSLLNQAKMNLAESLK